MKNKNGDEYKMKNVEKRESFKATFRIKNIFLIMILFVVMIGGIGGVRGQGVLPADQLTAAPDGSIIPLEKAREQYYGRVLEPLSKIAEMPANANLVSDGSLRYNPGDKKVTDSSNNNVYASEIKPGDSIYRDGSYTYHHHAAQNSVTKLGGGFTETAPPSGNPTSAGPSGPSGGGGGDAGGGGDGGGGGGGDKGAAALQAAQTAMGIASSVLGPIKDVLSSNKGETSLKTVGDGEGVSLGKGAEIAFVNDAEKDYATGGVCDWQDKQVCQNITVKVCDNTTSNLYGGCRDERKQDCQTNRVCVPKTGIGVNYTAPTQEEIDAAKQEGGKVAVILAQNNKDKEATTTIEDKGRLLDNSVNLEARIMGQANVYTPEDKQTDIYVKGSKGSPAPYYENTAGLASNVGAGEKITDSNNSNSVTGKAIANEAGGQYAKLIQHDLKVEGERIGVHVYKPFNEVEADGRGLDIKDGNTLISFNQQKTYYPREIKYTPYFMNKITNNNDLKNYFRLMGGGQDGNYLIDGNKRGTVGDSVVEHPVIKGVYISKVREEMFKRGYGMNS